MKQPVITGLGEVLWDVYPDQSRFGGAPANFACHAAQLGATAYVVSAVGQDELGQRAIESLEAMQVDCSCVEQIVGKPTGTVQVTLDDAGHPSYEICRDVAWDAVQWSDELSQLATQTDAVCFGSLGQRDEISRQTIRRFLESTRDDCLRVFDINLRQQFFNLDIIQRSLELANALKLNDDELPVVANLLGLEGDDESLLQQLGDRFKLKIAALTRGKSGSMLVGNGKVSLCPVANVEVVDTVGAGDSFTAALVVGLLQNNDLDDVHRHASRLAGYVCTQRGAVPRLPKQLPELP